MLASLGAAALAGCAGRGPLAGAATPEPTATEPCDPPTVAPSEDDGTPVRGRGDPVAVERELADEEGFDDWFEYDPESGEVRCVVARSGRDPVRFETAPFERWMRAESAAVARQRALSAVRRRLDTDAPQGSEVPPPEGAGVSGPAVSLSVRTLVVDCRVVSPPAVSLTELAAATPRRVDVALSLAGDGYAREVPVFAAHRRVLER